MCLIREENERISRWEMGGAMIGRMKGYKESNGTVKELAK